MKHSNPKRRGRGVQTRTACSVWQVSGDSISCGRTERWSTATPKEGGGGCRQEQPAVCDKCLVIVFPVAGQRDEEQQPQKEEGGGGCRQEQPAVYDKCLMMKHFWVAGDRSNEALQLQERGGDAGETCSGEEENAQDLESGGQDPGTDVQAESASVHHRHTWWW